MIDYFCPMAVLNPQHLEVWYQKNFEAKLSGRRILFEDIEPLIKKLSNVFRKDCIGFSERNIPIYKIGFGAGAKRILGWSQMHGNESTGTKALFDLFHFVQSDDPYAVEICKTILENCNIEFIVMLNPDGSIKFTRENANNIDLNRDAVNRTAVESTILRTHLDKLSPLFCFNLHDQRSIFNVSGSDKPATISFLAPSEDAERSLTQGRKETMSIIVAMNELLQKVIPGQVGRYTDEFYPTATGDNFQKLGHNTILIEAGHYKDDYDRQVTRKFNFFALIQGLHTIASSSDYTNFEPYFEIPNNDTKFLDIIYEKLAITVNDVLQITDVGIQLKYKVLDDKLVSYKFIEKIGNLSNYHTYKRINAENLNFMDLELSNS